jgi:hypothetical protein
MNKINRLVDFLMTASVSFLGPIFIVVKTGANFKVGASILNTIMGLLMTRLRGYSLPLDKILVIGKNHSPSPVTPATIDDILANDVSSMPMFIFLIQENGDELVSRVVPAPHRYRVVRIATSWLPAWVFPVFSFLGKIFGISSPATTFTFNEVDAKLNGLSI